MSAARLACCLLLLGSLGCSRERIGAVVNELREDGYALDHVSRDASNDAGCPEVELTSYRGESLLFAPPVRVVASFAERLSQVERLAGEIGRAIFGRAPTKVRHAGAYLCRPIRKRSARWSEHALGNALDVLGFDFPRMPRQDAGMPGSLLPAPLRAAFEVRVEKHWNAAPSESEQLKELFLRKLATELEEGDAFRGMIGPADPDHRTHLHLDMGPWRYRRL